MRLSSGVALCSVAIVYFALTSDPGTALAQWRSDPGAPPVGPAVSARGDRVDSTKDDDADLEPGWVWFEPELGGSSLSLRTLRVRDPLEQSELISHSTAGPMLGVGLGARLWVLRIGPRARAGFFDDGTYTSIGGEVGVHVPISIVEPHIDAGVGVGRIDDLRVPDGGGDIDVDGYYVRAGGGLNVRVSRAVSLGGNFSWEMLGMTPEGISTGEITSIRDDIENDDDEAIRSKVRRAEGASYGNAYTFTGVLGFRY